MRTLRLDIPRSDKELTAVAELKNDFVSFKGLDEKTTESDYYCKFPKVPKQDTGYLQTAYNAQVEAGVSAIYHYFTGSALSFPIVDQNNQVIGVANKKFEFDSVEEAINKDKSLLFSESMAKLSVLDFLFREADEHTDNFVLIGGKIQRMDFDFSMVNFQTSRRFISEDSEKVKLVCFISERFENVSETPLAFIEKLKADVNDYIDETGSENLKAQWAQHKTEIYKKLDASVSEIQMLTPSAMRLSKLLDTWILDLKSGLFISK